MGSTVGRPVLQVASESDAAPFPQPYTMYGDVLGGEGRKQTLNVEYG